MTNELNSWLTKVALRAFKRQSILCKDLGNKRKIIQEFMNMIRKKKNIINDSFVIIDHSSRGVGDERIYLVSENSTLHSLRRVCIIAI